MANWAVQIPVTSGVIGDTARKADNIATLSSQVTTDLAAAQAIGAGDAHAEIDTLDLSTQALQTALSTSGVYVIVNTTDVTTISKLQAVFDKIIRNAKGSGAFTA